MAADGTGTGWAENSPASTEAVSTGPIEFKDLRTGVRLRMKKEHVEPAGSTAGGEHKNGSAKCWYQVTEPTVRPDGTTALTDDDKGRLWFDTNARPKIYNSAASGFIFPAFYVRQAILRQIHSTGTDGGTAAAATWNTRILNSESSDPDGIVTLNGSTGVFTLNIGTYRIRAWAVAHAVGAHKLRLRRTNNTPATIMVSPAVTSHPSVTVSNQEMAMIEGPFSVTVDGSTFELQHWTEDAKSADGLGHSFDDGESDMYAAVTLEKIIG